MTICSDEYKKLNKKIGMNFYSIPFDLSPYNMNVNSPEEIKNNKSDLARRIGEALSGL